MKQNLDSLKEEIREHLANEGFAIFYGCSRATESESIVFWDTDQHPDFRLFLEAAKQAGARMIVFHARPMTPDYVEDAFDHLKSVDMPREERRPIERRLKEIRSYEGFTCALELSFDREGSIYMFNLRTEWYDELLDIVDEIEAALPEEAEDSGEDQLGGGYFSRN